MKIKKQVELPTGLTVSFWTIEAITINYKDELVIIDIFGSTSRETAPITSTRMVLNNSHGYFTQYFSEGDIRLNAHRFLIEKCNTESKSGITFMRSDFELNFSNAEIVE